MPPDPDDAETVAVSTAAGDTVSIEPPATLATSARRALDARAAPEPDPVQIGRFRIVARIGSGGMGVVFSAHDDELDRDVAIKLLRTNLAVDLSGRERLMREAQSIARLSHPNIVHVYEVGNDGNRVFMAMELIRGQTLRVYCKGRPWREIVDVFLGAGEGLAAAHAESIIHRDFKPDNVIVDERGRARVVDFGLARAPAATTDSGGFATEDLGPAVPTPTTGRRPLSVDLTGAGTVLGTPAYMAPEQLAKADPDARTDQFAFCVSLYEMLYERRPFKGSTYTEIARAVLTGLEVDTESGPRRIPRAVRRVILRGLSRAAEARFATMADLLVALRRASAPGQLRLVGYVAAAAAAGAIVVKLATPADPTHAAVEPDAPAAAIEAPADPWADLVARTDLPPTVPTPMPGDPTGVSVHRLRNGLTVYVAPRPMEPTVSVTVAVRAGSEQERDWGPGLAYMVMNSVYRGTERIGVRDAALERPALLAQHRVLEALPTIDDAAGRDAIVLATNAAEHMGATQGLPFDLTDAAAALGGKLSGSRTGSGTTYALELPALRIEGGLALVAEAVQRPVFRGVVGVVRDQLDLYTSLTSNDLAWQTVQRELAAATGLREDFEAAGEYMSTVPFVDARALHTTYYRPNNTAVVMVGDVTPERALELCEQYFGTWEPAVIPHRPPLDEPLPGGVVRREVEDGGAPAVFVSWPLPPTDSPDYPAFVALADALARQDGLGAALRERTGGASWDLTAYRSLDMRATARPDQTLADVEREVDLALRAIENDTLPDAAWEPALARAELTRLRWARAQANLTAQIAASFIDRRPWSAVVHELGAPPTRAELVGAARLLRERSRIVVHRRTGKTWVLPRLELPGERPPERYGGQSTFARSIIDAPVAPPEPRFLVAGSHYTVQPRGTSRFIAAEKAGPLSVASWVYPYGVDDDPFVCDAIRARIWAVRIAGMDFDAYCANDFVWVDVSAPAARFERDAALVFDWLDHGIPSDSELADHIERTLATRAARRDSAMYRNPSFHAWALRGDAAIQAKLPSDDALRRGGPARLLAALHRVDDHASDVLYAGPDVERIAASVPEGQGKPAPVRASAELRATRRDTIFVLDDPDRADIDVRVSLPWPDLDARTSLAAQIHSTVVAEQSADGPPSLALRWVDTPWWASIHPLAFQVEYFAEPQDAELALTTGVNVLRTQVPAAELEHERSRLESSFRAERTEMRRIPEVVRLWGSQTDPRVAEWLALPSLEAADMRRFYAALAEQHIVVSIVGDIRRLDLDALAEHGDVVRIGPAELRDILRDPDGSD